MDSYKPFPVRHSAEQCCEGFAECLNRHGPTLSTQQARPLMLVMLKALSFARMVRAPNTSQIILSYTDGHTRRSRFTLIGLWAFARVIRAKENRSLEILDLLAGYLFAANE
jgi:hypothetical protein